MKSRPPFPIWPTSTTCNSTVTQGLSMTYVDFEIGADPQKATDEVRAAIDRIRSSLPRGIEEPIVERFEIDSMPVVTYAVSGTDHVGPRIELAGRRRHRPPPGHCSPVSRRSSAWAASTARSMSR